MTDHRTITVTINGDRYQRDVPIRMLLVDFIRDVLGLTGTHVGCSFEGRCGACTIVVDGEAMKSCMMLAVQADGHTLLTAEGLERLAGVAGELHPIQHGFWEKHGLQCGYCTPGMMMTIFDLLRSHFEGGGGELTDETIRHGLVGNICRCTGYSHIVEAVKSAAAQLEQMSPERRRTMFDVAALSGRRA